MFKQLKEMLAFPPILWKLNNIKSLLVYITVTNYS